MKTVLFLGSTNSIRSPMAEAILRHHAGHRFIVYSAGARPTEIHPLTRRVLEEAGVDAASLQSKGVRAFLGRVTVDWAIILCEPHENGPRVYPFAVRTLLWPCPCPPLTGVTEECRLDAFRQTRDELDRRIRDWLAGEALAAHGPGSHHSARRAPALEGA